jgi:hypothetical protein
VLSFFKVLLSPESSFREADPGRPSLRVSSGSGVFLKSLPITETIKSLPLDFLVIIFSSILDPPHPSLSPVGRGLHTRVTSPLGRGLHTRVASPLWGEDEGEGRNKKSRINNISLKALH